MKNEEKAQSDANKRGNKFVSGNTVWRESFAGTSKALNALQVKSDCGEGNRRRRFSEYLQVKNAYLSTEIEAAVTSKRQSEIGKSSI